MVIHLIVLLSAAAWAARAALGRDEGGVDEANTRGLDFRAKKKKKTSLIWSTVHTFSIVLRVRILKFQTQNRIMSDPDPQHCFYI